MLYAMERSFFEKWETTIKEATAQEREMAVSRFGGTESPNILTINNDGTAIIKIEGALSPQGVSPLEKFLGYTGTSYQDIIEAARQINLDPSIKTVYQDMNTPGGTVAGCDEALQALKSINAEVIVRNLGMIASAGYYLASHADKIISTSPMNVTGSIGVIVSGYDVSDALARQGIKKVTIVSKNAPNKASDPNTENGRAVIQNEIDAMERIFIKTISEGRGLDESYIVENFGKGALLVANDPDETKPDALSVKMIDEVIGGFTKGAEENLNNVELLKVMDFAWDEKAATKRVSEFTCKENENLSYNFVDIINGEMVANIRAIRMANGKSGDQQKMIDLYKEKWEKQNHKKGEVKMDLNEFKATYPNVYADAVSIGAKSERERVSAHVILGEASGDTKYALECIKEGTELTPTVNAHHVAAGIKLSQISARASEEIPAVTPTPSADATAEADQTLADALAEKLGVSNA